MLHQIRKMVGTLMAVTRGHVPPDYITKVFDPNESAHLPTAPGLGLLLEQVRTHSSFKIMMLLSQSHPILR